MPPRLFLETALPSYPVARPNRDLILSGQQEVTRKWWDEKRQSYDLVKSIQDVPRLSLNESTEELAAAILAKGLIPPNAAVDASHIAVAAVHEMDILLTWNCKHIHNIAISRQIERVCARAGFQCPAICTPFDLLEA